MIRVQTASRLHFGLLSLTANDAASAHSSGRRRFGGVGLMIERPGIRLTAEPSAAWSAGGLLAERVLAFARRFAGATRAGHTQEVPHRFVVESSAPEHVGLGTGTQLGLAVGRCLATGCGLEMSVAEVAARVGRGERSAVGVHGFEHGGFLVEAGQRQPGSLGPLVARDAVPSDWRVVLARAVGAKGTHGVEERSSMAALAGSAAAADSLCRLVLLDMLPALSERDVDAFGEALFEFNARAGEPFLAIQGGTYSSPAVADLVSFLRRLGARGVGQSSWGPTVFAIVGQEDHAEELVGELRRKYADACDVSVTRAANGGARFEAEAGVR